MLKKHEHADLIIRLKKASRRNINGMEYVSSKAVELLLRCYTEKDLDALRLKLNK